jgi:hypothetical protein
VANFVYEPGRTLKYARARLSGLAGGRNFSTNASLGFRAAARFPLQRRDVPVAPFGVDRLWGEQGDSTLTNTGC